MPALPYSSVDQCQSANQAWNVTLSLYEQEIDLLLVQVAELLSRSPYRSVQHYPEQYYHDLNQLRALVQQVRHERLCEHPICTLARQQTCPAPQFGKHTSLPGLWTALADEFTRLKNGCCQLFTHLVNLNLL